MYDNTLYEELDTLYRAFSKSSALADRYEEWGVVSERLYDQIRMLRDYIVTISGLGKDLPDRISYYGRLLDKAIDNRNLEAAIEYLSRLEEEVKKQYPVIRVVKTGLAIGRLVIFLSILSINFIILTNIEIYNINIILSILSISLALSSLFIVYMPYGMIIAAISMVLLIPPLAFNVNNYGVYVLVAIPLISIYIVWLVIERYKNLL
ncbi:MAG: hypothetical protein F7C35_04435 [Desulfurococcales archaeon]|nr:hypothetical protein [Desulfurococcales archaeon]